ncbi:MAG: hypothetical protein ACFBQW_05520, partial [Sphingomonadaceae bacterium]
MATIARSLAAGRPAPLGAGALPRLLLLAALAALAVAVGWTGFIASDDANYYIAARHWLEAPPFAGEDHWGTRFPLVLTLAAALALLGDGPLALAAAALLWQLAFLAAGAALA